MEHREGSQSFSVRSAVSAAAGWVSSSVAGLFGNTKKPKLRGTGKNVAQSRAIDTFLERCREQGNAVALDDRQNIVVQRLADLNAAVKTERIEREALYQRLQAILSDRTALDTVPAILSTTLVLQLKVQLADFQRQQVELGDRLSTSTRTWPRSGRLSRTPS